MPDQTMHGVFPILLTPFDDDVDIDEGSLRTLIDFNLEAGVHGLGVALGSEIFKLSEAERDRMTRIVVDQVGGRVPVVINTGAAGTDLAVHYSRSAEKHGADALMIMPPAFMPAGAAEVRDYFQAIDRAVGIPIFIQDTAGAPVSPALADQIATECRWVRYIKVESLPVTVKVADMVAQAGESLTIFGGAGGDYFIEEMQRGSLGTMPFCTQPEAFVEIWNLCQRGDLTGARQIYLHWLLPVSRLMGQGAGLFYQVHKEILRRRGVIRTAKVRSPAPAMDDWTRRELQRVMDDLYPTSG